MDRLLSALSADAGSAKTKDCPSSPEEDGDSSSHHSSSENNSDRSRPLRSGLSRQQALEIFNLKKICKTGRLTGCGALAKEYSVSSKTIRDIWTGRSWLHATLPLWKEDERRALESQLLPRRRPGRPKGSKDRNPRRGKAPEDNKTVGSDEEMRSTSSSNTVVRPPSTSSTTPSLGDKLSTLQQMQSEASNRAIGGMAGAYDAGLHVPPHLWPHIPAGSFAMSPQEAMDLKNAIYTSTLLRNSAAQYPLLDSGAGYPFSRQQLLPSMGFSPERHALLGAMRTPSAAAAQSAYAAAGISSFGPGADLLTQRMMNPMGMDMGQAYRQQLLPPPAGLMSRAFCGADAAGPLSHFDAAAAAAAAAVSPSSLGSGAGRMMGGHFAGR